MGPSTPVSPWVYRGSDWQGRSLSVSAAFIASSPFTLTSVSVSRDAGCMYTRVYFGLGADGRPDTTPRQFSQAASGTIVIASAALSAFGFATLADLQAAQVTAGP